MHSRSAFRTVVAVFVTALLLGTRAAYASHGPSITALAIDPQTPTTLYAGTSDRGVFKSVDAGATWSLTGLSGIPITSLAIDVQNPSTVYAGTRGAGVFRLTTGADGGSWVAINDGLLDFEVAVVMIDPLVSTTLYAVVPTAGGGLLKSTNSGDTWIPLLLNADIPFPCCWYWPISATIYTLLSTPSLEPATPATLYAGVSYVGLDFELEMTYWTQVFQSTDGGSSWPAIWPQRWHMGGVLAVAA